MEYDQLLRIFTLPLPGRPGVNVVAPHGRLDPSGARALRAALSEAVRRSHHVLVDLSALTSCDPEGVSAVTDGMQLARAEGVGYELVGAAPAVARALALGGLLGLLPLHPDLEAALAALARGRGASGPAPALVARG